MSSSTSGATRVVAEFVTRTRPEAANPDAVGRVLVDTVGVAVAGVGTDVVTRVLDWVGSERAPGPATVWGTDLSLAPSQAALVNGTMAHALDWDDAVPSLPLHPGAVMIPALLARLSTSDTSGERLVAAYNVGSAVGRSISEVLPVSHHAARGWHNTASTGRLAATAALAHLVGLDPERTTHALGIATSMVAGSLANFGTMTKPLHAGLAARDAIVALALAERGVTANEAILEDRRGFFAMYGATTPVELDTLAERLEHWERAWVDDWGIKRYPSCYATHRAIDAAVVLHARVGDTGQVTHIETSVPHSEGSPLIDRLPRTGLEGKFSLDYTVARALTSGRIELDDFTDPRVLDGEVGRLMALHQVDRRGDGRPGPAGHHTSVTVRLADGREVCHGVDVTHGDARKPLSDAELAAKVVDALAVGGWPPAAAAGLMDRLTAVPGEPSLDWIQSALRSVS